MNLAVPKKEFCLSSRPVPGHIFKAYSDSMRDASVKYFITGKLFVEYLILILISTISPIVAN